MQTSLGKLLQNLRGDDSLRDIAEKTGLSHSYLRLLESGVDPRTGKEIKPSAETLQKLSKAYKYPYEKLLTTAGYLEEKDPDDSDLQPTPRNRIKTFQKKLGELSAESLDFLEYQINRLYELDKEVIQRKKAEWNKQKPNK